MPWPPTSETEFQIPLEYQLGAGIPAGLDADIAVGVEAGDSASALNASSGVIAPGTLSAYDNPFDLVERMESESKARRDALAPEGADGKRKQVIEYAEEKIGKWYKWGGESDAEGGFDCSGLLWYAFHKAGIDIPRVSMAQAERGQRVAISKLKPGDLVAWENNGKQVGADHIALYLGDGKILEAPHTGAKVRIRTLSAAEMHGSANNWGVKLDY